MIWLICVHYFFSLKFRKSLWSLNIIFEQLDNNNDRISFFKGNQPQQAPKPQPNTPYSNGQAQCVTTCKSDGSCKVFQVLISGNQLIYSGKLAGSCSSPLLGGSCSRIPDKCKRGSKIDTQCGSPCKTSTRTITEWKNKKYKYFTFFRYSYFVYRFLL